MDNKRKRRLRHRLVEKQRLCHWCQRPVFIFEPKDGGRVPDNSATLDHLYHKGHPMRGKSAHNELACVLSCWKCNNDRAIAQTKSLINRSHDDERLLSGPSAWKEIKIVKSATAIREHQKGKL